jgi:hypothetical protein
VLEAFGWQLALDRLTPFARWLPKHRAPRIFDTRFYIADLGTGAVDVAVDATENTHLFWASARGAAAGRSRRNPGDLPDAAQSRAAGPVR